MSATDSEPLVIRDVVMFTREGRREGDCRIEQGRIANLGDVATGGDARTIDGDGRWLFPGLFDPHVHFRDPGFPHKEDWTSGSAAALAGGVTTVFEMPNTVPPTVDEERLADKHQLADENSHCHFGLFFGATTDNTDLYNRIEGVPGLKIFMGTSTGDLLVSEREDLERVFAHWEGQIAVHAEDQGRLDARARQFRDRTDPAVHSEIRDPEAAASAVRTACELAVEQERNLHVLHLSTRAELQVVEETRAQIRDTDNAARITCEVCPHHLFLDTDAYRRLGTRARVNPPIRAPEQRDAMWEALRDGRVDLVATDHAPHTPGEKDRRYREAPSGLPGVQMVLPLMLDAARRGKCTPEQVVDWMAHTPSALYGVENRGRLAAGNCADLTLVDPEMERTVTTDEQFSKSSWTPWEGQTLEGWPVLTLVDGAVAYRRPDGEAGEIVNHPGEGTRVQFD